MVVGDDHDDVGGVEDCCVASFELVRFVSGEEEGVCLVFFGLQVFGDLSDKNILVQP